MQPRRSTYATIRWVKPQAHSYATAAHAAAATKRPNTPADMALKMAMEVFGEPKTVGSPAMQLRDLLAAAAEIEQQLMVEYLYARFSLAASAPAAWTSRLRTVYKEEMGHLLTVQNLLLLAGGSPHVARMTRVVEADEPFPLRIEPISTASLAKYVAAESPTPESLPADLRQQTQPAFDEAAENGFKGNRVGLLYAKIYWLFQRVDASEGPWVLPSGMFSNGEHIPDTELRPDSIHQQANPSDWGADNPAGHSLFALQVPDRAAALEAIHAIAQQGEGLVAVGGGEPSHFQQFLATYTEARALVLSGQRFPARPLPVNPTYGSIPLPKQELEEQRITDTISQHWAALFDLHYSILLSIIALSLTISDSTIGSTLRSSFAANAIEEQMQGVIAPVAVRLRDRPRKIGGDAQQQAAAAPFTDHQLPNGMTQTEMGQFIGALLDRSDTLIATLRSEGEPLNVIDPISGGNQSLRGLLQQLPVA